MQKDLNNKTMAKTIRMVMSNINNVQRYRHTGFKNWEDEIMAFQLLSI